MADAAGSCQRFNNAAQKVYKGSRLPKVIAWETNDVKVNLWTAEARLLLTNGDVEQKFPQKSADSKQEAKDLAASLGYQWLRKEFPGLVN
ncbi:hypothetical protein EST38_g7180 [Candolleomyces aberdarensis]|uniref:DRBM domain-containing protein n=1 Tax=Candolleomyces aberdarensis TaxID=2316362 RepID=A0A4Q2DFW8_9AGAR|nr:hypothetical protein EST38_g7180 [Candolleomyces aberdarensis]